uniref:Carboxypeptidase regulatory-like domain-containing protein n=1 Tax=candidate division WOR-3 bacterium TaxID=2052148 RepID=A0A7V0Z541_UNCW3
MKRILFLLIILFCMVCLKPPRDNPYDPDNPDKAYLTGIVTSPDGRIANAEVKLITDDTIYAITSTNSEGWYEFKDVDPGVYKLIAFADYFIPAEYSPESLPAGSSDTIELYFCGMKFTFDDDTVGTIEPFDFRRVYGAWKVMPDTTAPSLPNVYNCYGERCLALYNKEVSDFSIGVNLKFNNPVDTLSNAGIILRLKDSLNHYVVLASRKILSFVKIKNGNPIILATAPIDILHNQWYELWVEASGEHFKVYFDGELKIDKSDDEFSKGMTGLWVNRELPPQISVNFDDVVIFR